jgi:hypothetical protein
VQAGLVSVVALASQALAQVGFGLGDGREGRRRHGERGGVRMFSASYLVPTINSRKWYKNLFSGGFDLGSDAAPGHATVTAA